jgi:hypothetical protein
MAKPLDNYTTPWSCVRSPERSARKSSPGARRILAKLRELHQPLHPCPMRNPGASWGSTCLDKPCEQRPEAMLGVTKMRWESPEVTLVHFGIL